MAVWFKNSWYDYHSFILFPWNIFTNFQRCPWGLPQRRSMIQVAWATSKEGDALLGQDTPAEKIGKIDGTLSKSYPSPKTAPLKINMEQN